MKAGGARRRAFVRPQAASAVRSMASRILPCAKKPSLDSGSGYGSPDRSITPIRVGGTLFGEPEQSAPHPPNCRVRAPEGSPFAGPRGTGATCCKPSVTQAEGLLRDVPAQDRCFARWRRAARAPNRVPDESDKVPAAVAAVLSCEDFSDPTQAFRGDWCGHGCSCAQRAAGVGLRLVVGVQKQAVRGAAGAALARLQEPVAGLWLWPMAGIRLWRRSVGLRLHEPRAGPWRSVRCLAQHLDSPARVVCPDGTPRPQRQRCRPHHARHQPAGSV
jgi:hypothetical protein